MRVLVSDSLSEKGLALLRAEEGMEVVVNTKLSPEELIAEIPKYDALIVRSATKVTADVIEAATSLKVIGRAGVGVDNIDLDAATKRGIIVVNTPGGNSASTAEHTIAMLLAMARNIPQAHMSMKQGKWDRKRFIGVEVRGKVLGVIGLGRVGMEVVKAAVGLGMEVIGYDPFISADVTRPLKVKLADLDDLCRQSDFITVHTPLNEQTRGLIDARRLGLVKPGVRIVNCARGGIIDEAALIEALKSGTVAAAALDVYENEPPTSSELLALDNVVLTPHLGASTEEAQDNVAIDAARQVINVLKGQSFRNAVNLPSIDPETYDHLKPYLSLASRLGAFLGATCRGSLEAVEIEYTGELADLDVSPVTNYLLQGFLSSVTEDHVTIVNAPLIARSRGIRVSETKSKNHKGVPPAIRTRAVGKEKSRSISGTVYAGSEMRIIEVDGYRMDFAPHGDMLLIPHIDQPGVIGAVGQLLGREKINIAAMHVGRREIGGQAVMLLGIDGLPSRQSLDAIKTVDGVLDVYYVRL
ncbi:MAG: phosphoglycerate dehydrogenase [Bacillota bacterium]|jgi:D-3-phosphoglycerate dehydrogenase|nr:phosphoglycerate dehydrogenase [Bacillota bacterium]HOB90743.1 phosphoglycerate dehydrogenase [Bacillota bacterium]HPZ54076.1 phosphoglycerate dehydrogenase [Bacillota bacterium]HQD18174.1 phosphoglycerate dehydrogenase [Bacillota bacterium]